MSKSYKKTPYCGESKGKKKKKIANRRVRRQLNRNLDLDARNGNYKKLYNSWNICDYGWRTTWEEYWEKELNWYNKKCYLFPNKKFERPNKKESYQRWLRYYYRK